jgi:hypothetical protein
MDADKLLKALDNDNNEQILNFTTNQIMETNLSILKELHLDKKDTLDILNKLSGYKYVDEMNELNYGTYLRWVPMHNPNLITLTKGAIFCETKITDNGVFMVCKNYGFKSKHFQISLDNNLIFQKLTDQERIILAAMDHLSK